MPAVPSTGFMGRVYLLYGVNVVYFATDLGRVALPSAPPGWNRRNASESMLMIRMGCTTDRLHLVNGEPENQWCLLLRRFSQLSGYLFDPIVEKKDHT